jgi:hypothetical protein
MNLRYNIVWFEDSQDFINSLRTSIEGHLKEQGFLPEFTCKTSGEDALEVVEKADADLILIDFDLKQGKRGDAIVESIRKNELYTDVIFYSQHKEYLNQIGQLEGAFFSEAKDLRQKIPKIIDITLKRQQDVNNMRGVIIAETIDVERKIEQYITEYLGLSADETRRPVFERLFDYREHALTFKQKYEMVNSVFKRVIAKISNDLNVKKTERGPDTDAQTKALDGMKAKKEIFNEFAKIIEIRNVMAHWEEIPSEKNKLQYRDEDGKSICIDDAYCKQVRKQLREHSENLESLIGDVRKAIETKPKTP